MSRNRAVAHSRAQAGLDREEYFSRPGASAAGWLGGPHLVTRNRRRESDRGRCRGQIRDE